jgi:hypothetical protein
MKTSHCAMWRKWEEHGSFLIGKVWFEQAKRNQEKSDLRGLSRGQMSISIRGHQNPAVGEAMIFVGI